MLTALCCLPQVTIYQVLQSQGDAPGAKKLLAARLVPLQGSGWEVFAITQAVSCFSSGWVAQREPWGLLQELLKTHLTASSLSAADSLSESAAAWGDAASRRG